MGMRNILIVHLIPHVFSLFIFRKTSNLPFVFTVHIGNQGDEDQTQQGYQQQQATIVQEDVTDNDAVDTDAGQLKDEQVTAAVQAVLAELLRTLLSLSLMPMTPVPNYHY